MLRQLGELTPGKQPGITAIEHELLGGGALWLRAEPAEDSAQADALAAIVAIGIAA